MQPTMMLDLATGRVLIPIGMGGIPAELLAVFALIFVIAFLIVHAGYIVKHRASKWLSVRRERKEREWADEVYEAETRQVRTKRFELEREWAKERGE